MSDRVFPRSWSVLLEDRVRFARGATARCSRQATNTDLAARERYRPIFSAKKRCKKRTPLLGDGVNCKMFFVLATGAMSWPSTFVYSFLIWLLHRSWRTSFVSIRCLGIFRIFCQTFYMLGIVYLIRWVLQYGVGDESASATDSVGFVDFERLEADDLVISIINIQSTIYVLVIMYVPDNN